MSNPSNNQAEDKPETGSGSYPSNKTSSSIVPWKIEGIFEQTFEFGNLPLSVEPITVNIEKKMLNESWTDVEAKFFRYNKDIHGWERNPDSDNISGSVKEVLDKIKMIVNVNFNRSAPIGVWKIVLVNGPSELETIGDVDSDGNLISGSHLEIIS